MESGETTTTSSSSGKKACIACGKEFNGDSTVCPDDGTVLTPLAQEPQVGMILADRYQIIELISEGGMGKVYKARHLLMKRIVAIKMLHPNLVANSTMLKRFQQEAQATSNLNHPNIMAVYDFGVTQQGLPYLVMDYLEGTTIDAELNKDGHLPLKRALKIFVQCCQGLAHAHQKGVVHRDMKPANIMLVTFDDQPDFVKIVDFGIAKLLAIQEGESSHLTQTGDVFGSPVYMSPEQCRGKVLDLRTDIYSLGCVIYKTVTGCSPCSGSDLMDCMYRQVHDLPAAFGDACPELQLPESLERVIFKAVAKDPDDRYQSMAEFKAALEEILLQMTDNLGVLNEDSVRKTDLASAFGTQSNTVSSMPKATSSVAEELGLGKESLLQEVGVLLPKLISAGLEFLKKLPKLYLYAGGGAVVLLIVLIAIFARGPSGSNSLPSPDAVTAPAPVQQAAVTKPENTQELADFRSKFDAANTAYKAGKYSEAAHDAENALDTAHGFGTDDPNYIKSVKLLGDIYFSQGRYDESQNLYLQILTTVLQKSGEQSAEYADLLANIGRTATALRNYERAEEYLQKSLDIRQQVLGPTNLAVADSLSGLGYLALQQRDYPAAQKYLTSALNIRQDKLGDNDLTVASSMNDLGQASQMAGNRSEAESLYKSALAIRTKKLDKNNPQIAATLYCLAALMSQKNDMKQAMTYCKQALQIQQASLSPDNPSLARTEDLYQQLKHAVPTN